MSGQLKLLEEMWRNKIKDTLVDLLLHINLVTNFSLCKYNFNRKNQTQTDTIPPWMGVSVGWAKMNVALLQSKTGYSPELKPPIAKMLTDTVALTRKKFIRFGTEIWICGAIILPLCKPAVDMVTLISYSSYLHGNIVWAGYYRIE